jgi:hypothetical protein
MSIESWSTLPSGLFEPERYYQYRARFERRGTHGGCGFSVRQGLGFRPRLGETQKNWTDTWARESARVSRKHENVPARTVSCLGR